jgi:4-hydroxybenzoate polyprenyltransferase
MLTAALESLRPYQWLKNALVFVPLAAAHELGHIDLLMAAARSFVAFCLCASSVYLINDVRDAALDRLHPHKRHRPIAAGRLPRSTALALVPFLLAGAMIIIWPLGIWTTAALAFYFALMVAYSLYLKSVALLDALVLAGGYALRVITGGLAVAIRPSPRLLAFCIFLFFSLALVKRYAELSLLRLQNPPPVHVRGYLAEDRGFILALGTSCGALSALVLAVYMASENVARIYARSEFIWLTCVLLLYWISHVWLSAHRGRMPDDPLVFALKDPTSIVLVLLMGATAWLAV